MNLNFQVQKVQGAIGQQQVFWKAEAKLQVAPCALPLLARQDGEIMWSLSLVQVVPIDAALCVTGLKNSNTTYKCIMDGCVIKLLGHIHVHQL